MVYLDHYLDANDYNSPIKQTLRADFLQGSAYSSRSDTYYLKVLDFYSDNGWVLEDTTFNSTFQFDYAVGAIYPMATAVYNIDFTLSDIKEVYRRSYVKAQTVMANIGGFIKFIILFCAYINSYLAETQMAEHILMKFVDKVTKYTSNNGTRTDDRSGVFDTSKKTPTMTALETRTILPTNNFISKPMTNRTPSFAYSKLSSKNLYCCSYKSCNKDKNDKMRVINSMKRIVKESLDVGNLATSRYKAMVNDLVLFSMEERAIKSILADFLITNSLNNRNETEQISKMEFQEYLAKLKTKKEDTGKSKAQILASLFEIYNFA